jgi:hypothetical protein
MNSRRSMASLHHEGHYRHFEEYQTAALALCPWSQAANVRFASKAEITRDQLNVRFIPKADID